MFSSYSSLVPDLTRDPGSYAWVECPRCDGFGFSVWTNGTIGHCKCVLALFEKLVRVGGKL